MQPALAGAFGAIVAAGLAACWYHPLVLYSPRYGTVGLDHPAVYWLRVSAAVAANAVVYSCAWAIGMVAVRRFRAR